MFNRTSWAIGMVILFFTGVWFLYGSPVLAQDEPPAVRFNTSAYNVGEGAGTAVITVTLSAASGETVTVGYATANDTATAGSDYTAASGTLTFAPDQTSQTFSVPITQDALDEPDETVTLTLSSPTHATLGEPGTAVLTIVDDDGPAVRFSSPTYSANEGAGTGTIAAMLSAVSSKMVTVRYASSGGTASVGSDYTATSGTLTFAPGETSRTFGVPLTDDALEEAD